MYPTLGNLEMFWERLTNTLTLSKLSPLIYDVYYSDWKECWIIQYKDGQISEHKKLKDVQEEIKKLRE